MRFVQAGGRQVVRTFSVQNLRGIAESRGDSVDGEVDYRDRCRGTTSLIIAGIEIVRGGLRKDSAPAGIKHKAGTEDSAPDVEGCPVSKTIDRQGVDRD